MFELIKLALHGNVLYADISIAWILFLVYQLTPNYRLPLIRRRVVNSMLHVISTTDLLI